MGIKKSFSFEYTVYSDISELSPADQKLVSGALDAAQNSYSPYSGFKVGAALKLQNGETITGANQENAAFPSGLCAERTVMFEAGNRFPKTPYHTLAIAATSEKIRVNEPVQPCGGCRQVMSEHNVKFDKSFRVLLYGESGEVWEIHDASALLPLAFTMKL